MATNDDGSSTTDTKVIHTISTVSDVTSTTIANANQDNTLRYQEKEILAANGRDKVNSRDKDGKGVFETVENLAVTINPNTTRTNVLTVKNADGTLRTVTNDTQSKDWMWPVVS